MAKYNFEVHYDGQGLENNSIPIQDLAPSLLSLSEAFQLIQQLKNPNEDHISLNIKATQKGSFIAELLLVNGSDLINQVINMLNSNNSQAALNLTSYVTIFVGLVKAIKSIKNRKIKNKIEQQGQVTLTLDNDTKLTISKDVFDAYKDINIRTQVHEIVKPLNTDGIDSIKFTGKDISVAVKEDDYTQFEVPEAKEKELDSHDEIKYLHVVNVAFEHGKWKFSDGATQFFADIEDKDFIKLVEKNEIQFGSTDVLKVKLKTQQFIDTQGKLKSSFTILKVLDHIKGSQEIELDLYSKD